jgi:membrane protease YdiL (CAAX protease family)
MVKQRPLIAFFPLAFLLSWYPFILGKTHLVHTSGGINPLGPAVAALIAAGAYYRTQGIKELLGRYLPWRGGWSNYIFATMLPVLIVAIAAVLNILLGATRPHGAQMGAWREMVPRFVFIFLFVGLGEETGWRGFALPELQKRVFAPHSEFRPRGDLGRVAHPGVRCRIPGPCYSCVSA